MTQEQPEPNRQLAKGVRLICCTSGRCRGIGDHRVVLIRFCHANQPLKPYAMELHEAHRLYRELALALENCGEPFGPVTVGAGDTTHDVDIVEESPSAPKPTRRGKSNVKPTRRASCPTEPIGAVELWRWSRFLKNLKSHDDLLRFLGMSDVVARRDSEARQKRERRRAKVRRRKSAR